MINFISRTQLLSKKAVDAPKYVKKLKTSDIFIIYEQFQKFIKAINNIFENKEFCRQSRLFQNLIYMLFLDLIKVYNIFYIMITEILDRFKKMPIKDMEKALQMYKEFIRFTDDVKREANTIPLHFGFVFKSPSYYVADPKLEKNLGIMIQQKNRGDDLDEYDDFDLGDQMPDNQDFDDYDAQLEDRNQNFGDGKDEDSDDDIDILADVRQAEEFATHSGARSAPKRVDLRKRGGQQMEEQKIQIDDYNTAALDDLLAGDEPQRSQSDLIGNDAPPSDVHTADPFAEPNKYHDDPLADDFFNNPGTDNAVKEVVQEANPGMSLDDLMGGGETSQPTPQQNVQNVLDDNKISSNPAITPEFEKLKHFYNTSNDPAPMSNPTSQPQQPQNSDPFATAMPPMGGGFNPGMGNPGMMNPGMGNPGMGGMGMGNPSMMGNPGMGGMNMGMNQPYGQYNTGFGMQQQQ